MKKLFQLLTLSLMLGGLSCASVDKHFKESHCTYDAAYSQGMNDASEGRAMNPTYGRECDQEHQERAKNGYRTGYTKGLELKNANRHEHYHK